MGQTPVSSIVRMVLTTFIKNNTLTWLSMKLSIFLHLIDLSDTVRFSDYSVWSCQIYCPRQSSEDLIYNPKVVSY